LNPYNTRIYIACISLDKFHTQKRFPTCKVNEKLCTKNLKGLIYKPRTTKNLEKPTKLLPKNCLSCLPYINKNVHLDDYIDKSWQYTERSEEIKYSQRKLNQIKTCSK